jgi:hypothetical protein
MEPKARAAERLLRTLGIAIKTQALYPLPHPMTSRAVGGLLAVLRPYAEAHGPFAARVTRYAFWVDGIPFKDGVHGNLALYLYARKISHVKIMPAVSEEALAAFVSIAGMAEFYDAATSSRRGRRRPMLPSEAMQFMLNGAGTTFDPMLARVFVEVMGLYPVGSVAELDTGELAVVTRPGERDAARPVVKVVMNAAREPIEAYTVNLEEERDRQIVRTLDADEVPVTTRFV